MRRTAVGVLVLALLGWASAADATEGPPRSYIVVLRDSVSDPGQAADEHARAHGARVTHVYHHALRGYAASMSEQAAARIANDRRVAFVEPDGVMTAITDQPNPTWGLDRIDQRDLPLTSTYTYAATGSGVTAYIIDTGIRFDHVDFGGRAATGFDAVDGGSADDCNGHGTHVAGTVGGTTYGVAKGVSLIGVRVLGCSGSGSTSGVIAGIDWVTGDHAAGAPAVANMSLGGGASTALDTAVQQSIADGVTYGVAAGNSGARACNYSPARVPEALTVGATNSSDARASWSNYGTCLDLFAPGVGITSAWRTSSTATNTISGTSMATPHVVGAAALHLAQNPTAAPATVAGAIVGNATSGKVTSAGQGSPNRLLYVDPGVAVAVDPPTAPASLVATAVSSSRIDLSWLDNSTNETGFEIERSTDGTNFAPLATVGAGVTSYASEGLSAATTYSYRVRATGTGGASAYSNTAAATTTSAPSTGITLTATKGSNAKGVRQIHLAWSGASSPVSITRNDVAIQASVSGSTYTDSVSGGGTFRYQVCETGNPSTCSNTASVTT